MKPSRASRHEINAVLVAELVNWYRVQLNNQLQQLSRPGHLGTQTYVLCAQQFVKAPTRRTVRSLRAAMEIEFGYERTKTEVTRDLSGAYHLTVRVDT